MTRCGRANTPTCGARTRLFTMASWMLPKRRGRPLRSATKPCVRLIASHGSSMLRSVVIDTLRFVACMPLVVAVSVESSLVAELLTATHTTRDHMVDLNVIFRPEIQATPSAFSLLFLQQFSECGLC